MQVRLKILIVCFITILMLGSCDKYNESSLPPLYNETYVRLVSSAGTNVLDSLNVMGSDEVVSLISPQQMIFTERHTSSAYACDMQKHFVRVSPEYDGRFKKTETLIKLEWTDFNILHAKNGDTFVYTIDMQSGEMFGNNDIHTLRWYLKIGNQTFDAYKCELDGMETDMSSDPFYADQKSEKQRMVKALVTIVCR